jgi:hypothetical protein
VEDHGVEGAVVEGQCRPAAHHVGELGHAGGDLPRTLHEDGRRVEAHHLAHGWARRERARHGPGPAAHLQHARAVRQRQVGQVVLEHRLLRGVGRAQLEDVGEALLDSFVGALDAGVDVGHEAGRA